MIDTLDTVPEHQNKCGKNENSNEEPILDALLSVSILIAT